MGSFLNGLHSAGWNEETTARVIFLTLCARQNINMKHTCYDFLFNLFEILDDSWIHLEDLGSDPVG